MQNRRQTLLILLFLVIVAVFMTTFRMGIVRGKSMEPTFHDGQIVLVRRRNWSNRDLRRFDVVLVRKDRDIIIKRVYRLPGEAIDSSYPDILNHSLAYNLADYYEQQVVIDAGVPITHYTVPEGYVVLVGDNLKVSDDSRMFGPVPIADILGVVVGSTVPPYANHIPPRADQSVHARSSIELNKRHIAGLVALF